LRSHLVREQAVDELVRDIASFDADAVEPDLIAYRAAELGYDLTVPRAVVVVDVTAAPDDAATIPARTPSDIVAAGEPTLRPALLRTMRTTFAGPHDIVAAMPSDRFVVLPRARSGQDDELRTRCRGLVERLSRRHGPQTAVGIGPVATTVVGLHHAYQDASAAVRLGVHLTGWRTVNTIDDVRIHQLLTAIGQRPRGRFVDALTVRMRAETDWPSLRQTVVAWCESGFSLLHAADALHVHRNTLVYRLKRIARLTDRPVRDHRTTLALYLACLADQLDDTVSGKAPGPTP
jgi:carbohydrate diacid regulator